MPPSPGSGQRDLALQETLAEPEGEHEISGGEGQDEREVPAQEAREGLAAQATGQQGEQNGQVTGAQQGRA